ncbi:unnamed protein product, partial [Angiostrongylus costaricensis]|uniref:T-cell surface glycoprotein CD3 epsilon chain n=1 Tax=Angiostrongylus costaricensis TaxID=334426 RepID=A0A0R3PU27_ANGCS
GRNCFAGGGLEAEQLLVHCLVSFPHQSYIPSKTCSALSTCGWFIELFEISDAMLFQLHQKLEKEWQKRSGCERPSECLPVKRFLQSETLIIVILCTFLLLQAVLLIASIVLCEHRSHVERKKLLEQRDEDDD